MNVNASRMNAGDAPRAPGRWLPVRDRARWFPRVLAAPCVAFLVSAFPGTGESRTGIAPAARVSPAAAMNSALAKGFGSRAGSGVVMDVSSGRVVAAKDLPLAARRLVLPGSTIKPFVLSALLEAGKLRSDEAFTCPIKLEIDGTRFDCAHPEHLGPMLPGTALAYSCNNFFAKYASRLTAPELVRGLEKWGFTSKQQQFGDVLPGQIVLARTPGELQKQALGEAGIQLTPLGLLQAYRRLALRRRNPATHGESLNMVLAALEGSVNYGTAKAAKTEGLSVAGKTGTSLADEGKWSHGWFAGYAPADTPEIAVVIFLERGRGPGDAAVIAHDVFAAYRNARPRK